MLNCQNSLFTFIMSILLRINALTLADVRSDEAQLAARKQRPSGAGLLEDVEHWFCRCV